MFRIGETKVAKEKFHGAKTQEIFWILMLVIVLFQNNIWL